MKIERGRLIGLTCWVLAGAGIALSTSEGAAPRFDYVITFDNVAVRGIEGIEETPETAHQELPGAERSSSEPGGNRGEPAARWGESWGNRPEPGGHRVEPGANRAEPGGHRVGPGADWTEPGSKRAEPREASTGQSPSLSWSSLASPLPLAPGSGTDNPSFIQEGFLVEAFWAVKTGTREAFFKRAHFHPADLSSGFEAQHLGNPNELHGILIRSLDGKRFGLKSLRYRITRNRQLPNKPISIEGFSTFNVNVLVARSFDPRGPTRVQFVSFP